MATGVSPTLRRIALIGGERNWILLDHAATHRGPGHSTAGRVQVP